MNLLDKFNCLGELAPKHLNYSGDLSLLHKPIISIVGSRKMSVYTKNSIKSLASRLVSLGAVIASGGALGVDIAAAEASYPNTIAVLPSGLDELYPKSNVTLLQKISQNGLLISEYESSHQPRKEDFLYRNRLVVALGHALIIAQADYRSGSLNSANWAQKLNKPIYVLSQPIGASNGSLELVAQNKAKLIYDLDEFISNMQAELNLSNYLKPENDEVLDFIGASGVSFDEAYARFGQLLYEYELDGKITIDGVYVRAL